VVATPVAVDGLQAENGRELTVAGDPDSFCSALSSLLQDPGKRAAMGEAAVALVKQSYDNAANTARLLEFYTRMIHGS